jgi:hypothetical protein
MPNDSMIHDVDKYLLRQFPRTLVAYFATGIGVSLLFVLGTGTVAAWHFASSNFVQSVTQAADWLKYLIFKTSVPAAAEITYSLIYLTAISIVITIYLGLRGFKYRQKDEGLRQALESRLNHLLFMLDIENPTSRITAVAFFGYPVYALCYALGIHIQTTWWRRILYAVRRQIDFPLLGYFRAKTDIYITISVLVCQAGILLLLLSKLTIANQTTLLARPEWIFIFNVVADLWIITTAVVARRLRKTGLNIDRLSREIMQRVAELTKMINMTLEDRTRFEHLLWQLSRK